MANPADIRTIQTDVTNISNASWNWHALTSDAKVVNRTCYGLILQWLPKSIIPTWFKCWISNADVSTAHDKVQDKIITLLTHSHKLPATDDKVKAKLQDTCAKATRNMNALIDKINKARPQNNKLLQLDLAALKHSAELRAKTVKGTGEDEGATADGTAGGANGSVGSPTSKKKRPSLGSTPETPKPDTTTVTPEPAKPARNKNNKTPHPAGTTTPSDLESLTPTGLKTPKGKANRKSMHEWEPNPAYHVRRRSQGGALTPLLKDKTQKKPGK